MVRFFTLLYIIFSLGFQSVFAEEQSLKTVHLQLKWFHQFQFAGYYAAVSQGYYEQAGLDVVIHERDPSLSPIDRVTSGEAQFAVADASMVLSRMQGNPVVALAAIFQHSPMVLFTRAEDQILGPEQLIGKRIMRQRSVDDAVVTAMLYVSGVTEDLIIDQPHSFNDMTLVDGETDAIAGYLTNQPFLYKQLGLDIGILNPANYGIDFYGDILITSEEIMKNDLATALAFREASIRGWAYALTNTDEIIDLIRNEYSDKKSAEHLRFEAESLKNVIVPSVIEIGNLSEARFRRIASIYADLGMAPRVEELPGMLYTDYLSGSSDSNKWLVRISLALAALGTITLILLWLIRRLRKIVRDQTRKLRRSNERMETLLKLVDKYIIISSTNKDGKIIKASQAFCEISKYPEEELMGRNHNILRHPKMPSELYKDLWDTITAGKIWEGEILNAAKDGSEYWVHAHIEPDFDGQGNIIGYTAIRQDITNAKLLETIAETDALTGINNRKKLDQVAIDETDRVKRFGGELAIIMFDIDHFKAVNDTHGHQAGDAVLIAIAQAVHKRVRAVDTFGRWGGEEFMIICPQTNLESAMILAEKVRQVIERIEVLPVGTVTSSFGVASCNTGHSLHEMVEACDAALYEAKSQGRNCCVAAGPV